jgi:hypothetical protein
MNYKKTISEVLLEREKIMGYIPKIKRTPWTGHEDVLLSMLLVNHTPESLRKRGQEILKSSKGQLVDFIDRSKILDK